MCHRLHLRYRVIKGNLLSCHHYSHSTAVYSAPFEVDGYLVHMSVYDCECDYLYGAYWQGAAVCLGKLQKAFMSMLPLLHALKLGYEVRSGHLRRCNDCKVSEKNSVHKLGLAIDLHLFRDGIYLTDGTGHHELHDYWDTLGGAPRIEDDLNHSSLEWEGRW